MTGINTYRDLLTAGAVRAQSEAVTNIVRSGNGLFWLNEDKLAACAQLVADTTLERYPTLDIPYHSRWRHFHVEGSDLLERLDAHLSSHNGLEQVRIGFDLVIPSVLLDAGAGSDWSFHPGGSARPVGRSEGLGLASLSMFLDGKFSAESELVTDAQGLVRLSATDLASGFQATDENQLLALPGRLAVLNALGSAIQARTDIFPNGRVGDLADYLLAGGELTGGAILETLLDVLAPIWPSRLERDGLKLGDAWHYEQLGDGPGSIVPFHKLSQWLSYSLVETFERSGHKVSAVDQLTGLPEYRNGGLLLETGVIGLSDKSMTTIAHEPASPVIVEWRALTITQLDVVAELVRSILNRPEMLLVEILEGGTWATGRRLAFERDPVGRPPLKLASDGTVF